MHIFNIQKEIIMILQGNLLVKHFDSIAGTHVNTEPQIVYVLRTRGMLS